MGNLSQKRFCYRSLNAVQLTLLGENLPMSLIEHYRLLYEYEKDCNLKMLAMLESVPETSRSDTRFQQAVTIAGHLAACRENWLDNMQGEGAKQVHWFDEACVFIELRPRFAAIEAQWTAYLATLDDAKLVQDFEFPIEDNSLYSLRTEIQVVQLFAHAPYHRGQIALLVDQLGGETVDTDYVDWAVSG